MSHSHASIFSDLYVEDPPADTAADLPKLRRVSNADDARYYLLAWSSPARVDSGYATAVVEKYLRSKLQRSRSRSYINTKLEVLEKQLPESATLDNAFQTVRRRYSLPPSRFREAPPPLESPPVYSAADPQPDLTRTLLEVLPAEDVLGEAPPYTE